MNILKISKVVNNKYVLTVNDDIKYSQDTLEPYLELISQYVRGKFPTLNLSKNINTYAELVECLGHFDIELLFTDFSGMTSTFTLEY